MFPRKLTQQVICEPDNPLVETKMGTLRGLIVENTYIFRGIQYAQAKRFQMPEPVEPWVGVKEALVFGPVSPEMSTPVAVDQFAVPRYHFCQDENCLYLNVWTQSIEPSARKPVMVCIHGGGWETGSSVEQYAYDGEEMSCKHDVVFVSLNHRLNCIGFLDLSAYGEQFKYSGVVGLADIVAALQWIHDNIELFGGDPNNVTLVGPSGGGEKIRMLLQTPEADGLYHKAIIQSGVEYEFAANASEVSRRLADLVITNLGLSPESVEEAAEVPYFLLARAAAAACRELEKELHIPKYKWQPAGDTDFCLGESLFNGFREETAEIPLIIGTNFGEYASNYYCSNGDGKKNRWSREYTWEQMEGKFGDKADKLVELFEQAYPEKKTADFLYFDYMARRDAMIYARRRSEECAAPVWMYQFNLEMPCLNGTTPWRGAEAAYVFHNGEYLEGSYIPGITEKLQDAMAGAWAAFARTGTPNHLEMPKWEPFETNDLGTMVFDEIITMKYGHDVALLACCPQTISVRNKQNGIELGGGPRQSF